MEKSRATIFIVDDEPLLAEMLTDYLHIRDESYRIKSYPTGEACLQNIGERPDIVILDYYLNAKERDAANGIDILKEIRSRDKSLPVIMLSSQENFGTAAKTIMHGAIHYVPKGQDAFGQVYDLIKSNI